MCPLPARIEAEAGVYASWYEWLLADPEVEQEHFFRGELGNIRSDWVREQREFYFVAHCLTSLFVGWQAEHVRASACGIRFLKHKLNDAVDLVNGCYKPLCSWGISFSFVAGGQDAVDEAFELS
jgi:hypothetical protein